MIALIALPASVVAASATAPFDTAADLRFDTPAPEKTAAPKKTTRPKKTQRPKETAPPAVAQEQVLGPLPVPFPPDRTSLIVGYSEPGVLGQAPFLVAQLAGYFEDAGFSDVTIVEVPSAGRDVTNGDLDFAVVPSRQAWESFRADPIVPAVAGFQNYDARNGRYGGSLIVSRPGLVADEPATVIAFLSAYIRALGDLSSPESAAETLGLIEESEFAVEPQVAADWQTEVARFTPFDGGFGSANEEQGQGELAAWLAEGADTEPELDQFIASHTLNIAQAWSELPPNPDDGLAGAPSIADISVGLPLVESNLSPIVVADEAGYLADAGFESVEILDIEQPFLGLLNGELDFGVVDVVDAADGVSQGLPIVVVAGHQNYAADGTYGGDVLLVTTDLLEGDPSTATAFLIAYVQGLQDLADSADATGFAPFDGGLGDRADEGGIGELRTYLARVQGQGQGQEPDLEAMISVAPLEFAQAWWGLPADPTDAPQLSVTQDADPSTEAVEEEPT